MALTAAQYRSIRHELDTCKKPLVFFHDDPDGVCSFVQLYLYHGDAKGVIVKSQPRIDTKFIRKVQEYDPDKIFVLDIALMDQEFVDEIKSPVIWVDHHQVQQVHDTKYYNPRIADPEDSTCVSYLVYNAVKKSLWIAAVGTVGDMQWPQQLIRMFRKEYPDLLPESIKEPRDALYNSQLGKLVKIFSFVLKGTSSDAMRYVKVLTRIRSPGEILGQETAQGRYIYKRFAKINEEYEALLKEAGKSATDDDFLVYTYDDNKMSFSGDLANELIYMHPDKLIIAARRKSGEYKCSFRSNDLVLPPILQEALVGCDGHAGGHEHACGGAIKEEDFERFISNLRKIVAGIRNSK